MSRFGLFAALLIAVTLGPWQSSSAQEFRIDTDIFVGKEKAPVSQTLTIFTGTRVYDFILTEPREIVVWDSARGKFTLIDEMHKRQTVVTSQDVIDFAFAVKLQANQVQGLFAFAASPQFSESTEEVQENAMSLTRVVLDSPNLRYDAKGQKPKFPQAVTEYNQFATWYARLNATRPGNLPPEARIALNRAMSERGLIPVEIIRTTNTSSSVGNRKLEVRSHHLVNWTLSGEDQKNMQRADDAMAKYTMVTFEEYRKVEKK